MKRVIFSVVSTIVGLVALLSFKSQNHATVGAALPSAGLGASSSPAPGASSSPAPGANPAPASSTAGEPSSAASTPASASKTFDGSAVQTRYGTVQAAVTVLGSKITNVSFLQLSANDGRSADINSQAAPLLLQETLSAQSSNINTISGATFTSEGYLQSLQSALDQAGIK
ncbi:MAG: putative FMN-binding protein [Frankiales bacterium]|nr:putative FMN-binding protein [Frankiales bacterium]